MLEMDLNWLAVLVVTVGYMAVGALWYGPLFQKPWMRMSNMNEAEAKAGAPKAYSTMFVVALVGSWVLGMFIVTVGADTFTEGMMIGFWLWLGFQATVMLNSVIFEKKPFQLYLINVGYNLVMLLLGGGVLAVWK